MIRNPKKMMTLFGNFLLEIRKSLGNKRTKLDEFDMLRAMIKDIDRLQSEADVRKDKEEDKADYL